MKHLKNVCVKLGLITLSLLTGLFVSECILRIVTVKSGGLTKLTQIPSGHTEFDKITDWKSLENSTDCPFKPNQLVTDFITNSHGFLSEDLAYKKPDGVKRILYLGDSFLTVTPYKFHFIPIIETSLNQKMSPNKVESINLGIACTGTSVYQKAFEVEGSLYSPDVVVVNVFVGNDFTDDQINSLLLSKHAQLNKNPLRIFYDLKTVAFIKNMFIVLTEYLPQQNRRVTTSSKTTQAISYDPFAPTFSPDRFLEIEQQRSEIIKIGSPIYLDFSLIQNNLLDMKKRASTLNAKFVVVIIPDEMQVNKALYNEIVSRSPTRLYDIHQPQQVLKDFLDQNNIEYVDLLSYFEAEDNPQRYYQPNDTHFNSLGNNRTAEILSPVLYNMLNEIDLVK